MAKKISRIAIMASVAFLATTSVQAEVSIGTDVVSRYVWRGTDFGNAASVQPYLSYSSGPLEVGAWSSWALSGMDGDGASENDLYITYSAGPVGVTLTDYYFPESGNFLGFAKDQEEVTVSAAGDTTKNTINGYHLIEISASYSAGPLGLMGGFFFWGDTDDSFYAEINYELMSSDDMSLGLTSGAGNGQFTTDTNPNVVNLAITATKDSYSASYIINPEAETTFLVFGMSF